MLSNVLTPDGYYVTADGRLTWNVKSDVIHDIWLQGVKLCEEAKNQGIISKKSKSTQLINVFDEIGEYNYGDITIERNGSEYVVNIGIRLTTSINQKGLKQLLRLTGYTIVDELYNALYQSFEGTGSPINYESFVDIAGHQVKAVNNGNSITYIIK